jgi:hypothetical protein
MMTTSHSLALGVESIRAPDDLGFSDLQGLASPLADPALVTHTGEPMPDGVTHYRRGPAKRREIWVGFHLLSLVFS